MPETIESPQNEKLKLVRRLARRRGREGEQLFVSEGEDLLSAGRAAGWEPEFVLVAAGSGLGGTETAVELLDSVSGLGSGTRALAVWALPDKPAAADEGAGIGAPCVYLHRVADPGNVGSIVRTAVALAGTRVVLGPGCADPWGPKAVRASMGALFSKPPVQAKLAATPMPRLALLAHGGDELDSAVAATRPATICLGAERDGLDPESLRACQGRATIATQQGTESLNVAATTAIALHRVCSLAGRPPGSDSAEPN